MEGFPNSDYKKERKKQAQEKNINVLSVKINGGESFEDEIKRIKEFLHKLKKENYNKVLIITHYDIIQAIKIITEDYDLKKIKEFKPKNCEIFKFELTKQH